MANRHQNMAQIQEDITDKFPWIVLYLDRNVASEFRLWAGIFSVIWEIRKRNAGPIEREMYACIRNFLSTRLDPDKELMIAHCKELVLRMGAMCDPRLSCPHYRDQYERNREYRNPAPFH